MCSDAVVCAYKWCEELLILCIVARSMCIVLCRVI